MTKRIERYAPQEPGLPARRRGMGWASWFVVAAGLVAQMWIVTAIHGPVQAPLMALGVVGEYAAIAWCEGRTG